MSTRPHARTRTHALNDRQLLALAYVEEHGEITRREYADLCPYWHGETLRLDLAALVDRGLLARHGAKRGTHYTPSVRAHDTPLVRADGIRPKRTTTMEPLHFLIREDYDHYIAVLQDTPMHDGEHDIRGWGRTPQQALGNLITELARAGLVACSIKHYLEPAWEPWPPTQAGQ